MMKNSHLLNESQVEYMERILTDPESIEFLKDHGKRYATIEYSIIKSEYRFMIVEDIYPHAFRGEIVEYVEL